jgi:hypothetical protein
VRAALFAFGVSLVLGLSLGLLLTGTGPGASGIVGGEFWILVLVFASVFLGWLVTYLIPAALGVPSAPLFVLVMVAALLAVKFVRIPWAPLVADGFGILVAIYAAAGLFGGLVARTSGLRATTRAAAARVGLWLATLAVSLTVATYGLASVLGS